MFVLLLIFNKMTGFEEEYLDHFPCFNPEGIQHPKKKTKQKLKLRFLVCFG